MKQSSLAPSAASTSSASASTVSDPQHVLGHGLRSQFGQLLPKHALFRVHVDIDQLSNVPLMGGQFAVRWKFKNVQSHSRILSKMKKGNHSWASKGKGKGRASDLGLAIEVTPADGEDGDGTGETDGDSSGQDEGTEDEVYTPNMHANSSYRDLLSAHTPGTAMPLVTPTPTVIQKTTSATSTTTCSVARGATPWRPLQSYNVKWEHHVNVRVQMDVHRETGDLLPSELKLVVVQRVIPGDPDAPRQPRLGAVYLNLAQYADAGPVTRRYLLRESKTNATLKLTVELEHVSGTSNYRPPPLRKGEIMASVTGLLSNNDLLRTSIARQLDEYTHRTPESNTHLHTFMDRDDSVDGTRLATSYGLRSTEDLIETLFNPVPSARPDPSPFTYYAPPLRPQRSDSTDTSSDNQSLTNSAESQSMHSFSSDSVGAGAASGARVSVEKLVTESMPDLVQLETVGHENGHKAWWRKIRSGTGTPLNRQFKLQPPLLPRHTEVTHA